MSLEELLRSRVIRRIRPNQALAVSTLKHAFRDIDTAKTLVEGRKFDWSLAVSYNAMLLAGRSLMFNQEYRPSSTEGHVAVVRFLQASLGVDDRLITILNQMRQKRHRVVYEEMDIVSEGEANQALKWAREFATRI